MLDIGKLLGIKSEMDSATVVKTDIYRYKRNTLASGLALLSLVLNASTSRCFIVCLTVPTMAYL